MGTSVVPGLRQGSPEHDLSSRPSTHHLLRLIDVARLALARRVLEPGECDPKRSDQDGKLLRIQVPARCEAGRRIADGPPGRTLWWISRTLRGGIEDLTIGLGAEGDQRLVAGGLNVRLRCCPGLLLPLADQG